MKAIRNIAPDKEIIISYIELRLTHGWRKDALRRRVVVVPADVTSPLSEENQGGALLRQFKVSALRVRHSARRDGHNARSDG